MSEISWIEWLGYTASALVLISLSMSAIARLRWFNLAGASCFTVYGYLIEAWPVAAVNFAIAMVNIFYLVQFYTKQDYFKVRVIHADDAYLREFLEFHESLVRKWYPSVDLDLPDNAFVLLSLRNMAVAGVFAGVKTDRRTLKVLIDFVIPEYADHKIGRFLFQQSRDIFLDDGITRLIVDTGQVQNERYFRKMGFVDSPMYGPDQLELRLKRREDSA